jgi:hypothetical protein
VDGVAVQAAHNLGAPRRRLPSHVSKEAPSISPPLSLPRRIPYGEVALSRFAFATHRVLGWVGLRRCRDFLLVRKGIVLGAEVQ